MANSVLDITKILNEYSKDIQDGITEKTIEVAKYGANKLKNTSPKKTGKYKKGWRVNTEKSFTSIKCTIHNATDYQLTHLLEKEHLLRNGQLYSPKKSGTIHIAPVEEECIKKYTSEVEEIIKKGG